MFNAIKNDPILKAITIVVVVLIALGLVFLMFGLPFNKNYGIMEGYNGSMMSNYTGSSGMMGGYGGWNISGVLMVLIRILLTISVIGLVVGLAVFLYQKYTSVNKQKPNSGDRTVCSSCSTPLKMEWKCCPVCGTDFKK